MYLENKISMSLEIVPVPKVEDNIGMERPKESMNYRGIDRPCCLPVVDAGRVPAEG